LKTQPINRSEDWPRDCIIAQSLAKGSARLTRRIAANIAKLPELLSVAQRRALVNRIARQRAAWCSHLWLYRFGVVNWTAFLFFCLISACVAVIIAAQSGWIG
jgi:hypothetical protein